MPPGRWQSIAWQAATIAVALIACTAAVYLLENGLGLPDASAVYLLGVAAIAIRLGATPAIATAAGAFLAYNFLFVEPRYTFVVANPELLLNLILFLVIGATIGRLAGQERDREQLASRREREARGLYAISRALSTGERLEDGLARILERLVADTRMDRAWVTSMATGAPERVLSDTGGAEARPDAASYAVLVRDDAEANAMWRRIHGPHRQHSERDGIRLYRVDLAMGPDGVGGLWAARRRELLEPSVEESRLLASAADQIGQAVRRQQLAATAAEVEIARRSDRAKSALLDSVSHDLRTPLATIRAAAGSLADGDLAMTEAERIELGTAIDREADRLNRLVRNLLDMSRIESGAVVPDLELVPIGSIVEAVVERLAELLRQHRVIVELAEDLPAVWADPLLLDQILTNLLENVARYVPAQGTARIRATPSPGSLLSVVVEDDGASAAGDYARMFEKFRTGDRQPAGGDRRGIGLGLAVVRGLAEAMGGSVSAGPSPLGGLAITVVLRADEAARDLALRPPQDVKIGG